MNKFCYKKVLGKISFVVYTATSLFKMIDILRTNAPRIGLILTSLPSVNKNMCRLELLQIGVSFPS